MHFWRIALIVAAAEEYGSGCEVRVPRGQINIIVATDEFDNEVQLRDDDASKSESKQEKERENPKDLKEDGIRDCTSA